MLSDIDVVSEVVVFSLVLLPAVSSPNTERDRDCKGNIALIGGYRAFSSSLSFVAVFGSAL